MDYENFYKDHIPKSSLPSDFGGDLDTIEKLHEKHNQEFLRLRSYFIAEEQQAALKLDVSSKMSLQSELLNESERGVQNMTLSD